MSRLGLCAAPIAAIWEFEHFDGLLVHLQASGSALNVSLTIRAGTNLDAVAFRLALRDIVSPLAVDGHRVHADIGGEGAFEGSQRHTY